MQAAGTRAHAGFAHPPLPQPPRPPCAWVPRSELAPRGFREVPPADAGPIPGRGSGTEKRGLGSPDNFGGCLCWGGGVVGESQALAGERRWRWRWEERQLSAPSGREGSVAVPSKEEAELVSQLRAGVETCRVPGEAPPACLRLPQGGSCSPGNARPPGEPRSLEVRHVTLPSASRNPLLLRRAEEPNLAPLPRPPY